MSRRDFTLPKVIPESSLTWWQTAHTAIRIKTQRRRQRYCAENRKSVRFANKRSESENPDEFSAEVGMRHRIIASLALTVCLVTVSVPLWAHHGTGVAYVRDKEVTLKGTVTEWFWANPHCGLLFDVTDDTGQVVHWGAELGNPHSLSEAGFSREVFKPGDKLTVTGHPAKSGAPRLELLHLVLADGRVLPEKSVKGNGVHLDDPGQ
jgi:hypothetical protein